MYNVGLTAIYHEKGTPVTREQLTAFVSIPPSLYQELFSAEADATLCELVRVARNEEEKNLSAAELAALLPQTDILITGWGSPKFSDELLDAAERLKLIAHSAGSIKFMLPEAVFDRGIAVTHAAVAMGPGVADLTLLFIMLCLRRVNTLDREMKAGTSWNTVKAAGMGREIVGQRVGVVGAGYTGKRVIALLKALNVEVWVADPYLSEEAAVGMGVRKASLDELLSQCPIVTLQAPPTDETYHMIGVRELGLLQDGAIFVNTARAHLVDQDALIAELQTGRIQAALDVYDQEPLPEDSPLRSLDNVILTPHIAAATVQTRLRQGQTVVDEIRRYVTGEPLKYQVTKEMLPTMA